MRVDGFSAICGECETYKEEILNLVQGIGNMAQLPDKETSKNYFSKIDEITKHLRKQHKLVAKGYYVGLWSGIGLAIGTVIGMVIGNSGIGTAIGTIIGLAVGLTLDAKAKREDRIL
jgi:hypothetical protein